MIVDAIGRNKVLVRYRDEDGDRCEDVIDNHVPYLFVETEILPEKPSPELKFEDGFTGLYGEALTKVTSANTDALKFFKDSYPTWEGNIPFGNRVLIDRLAEGKEPYKNYEHRVWYLDCEWHPQTNQMRVIVVKDSFTGHEYVWFRHKDYSAGKYDSLPPNYRFNPEAKAFDDEKSMLEDFVRHMQRQDPDVITGWYVVGADIKTIIQRCKHNNIDPRKLSPIGFIRYKFGDWEQPIAGRNCIDLMVAFSKLWELKNGKLPGYKLDDVAKEVLGKQKVELADGHDTYYSDIETYVEYCRQDVRLLPQLDNKINAIDYFLSLQHIVQCDIRSTPWITKMVTSLALQDEKFDRRIPTKAQFAKEDYEGADIMQVEPNVYNNIGILDIKAMYHSNAALHNISWETLYEIDPLTKEITDKCDLYLGALSDVDDFKDCGNGTFFTQGKTGLLVRMMDKMTNLRNKFKRRMVPGADDYDKWDAMQFACKSLVASMYGVAGDSKVGFYHPKIAAAITYTSRQTLNRLKTIAEEHGNKVIYGHTDSVFCSIDSPTRGEELMRSINAQMAPIEVEFEKWCSSIILMAKNRYAGMVTWTDGTNHDGKLYVKGIEMKQSRMPQVMKDVMKETITEILGEQNQSRNEEYVRRIIRQVMAGEYNTSELCMKGKLTRNISEYKTLSGNSAAAAWANENLGKGYRQGSFFLTTLDTDGNYIAFDSPEEIEGIKEIGYEILLERFVIKKIEPYYIVAGWDILPLQNAIRKVHNPFI